ncbi:MAG: ADP-ribosylation factor-directed GTPase activating protein isoform b [Pirellulales bacterium]
MGERRRRASWTAVLFGLGLWAAGGCSKPEPQIPQAPLPSDAQLRDRVDRAIEFTYTDRHLNSKDQAAWQIVHGALAYGRDFQIYHDGQLVSAIDYLLHGGSLRGWVLRKGDHGLEAVLDAGSKMGQGHEDQWLGYLSQCGIAIDQPIKVGDSTYTVNDLVTQAQWDIYDGMEATWTLMALGSYLPLDARWTAKDGSEWNIDRIVRMETAQNLADSPCGGTHRLYALTRARNRYLDEGGELNGDPKGTWEQADKKIRDAAASAREFQQPDGSFSTNYFSRAAASAEIDGRISSSGHVLEFLMVALDDDQIRQAWVTRAVVHLLDCLEKTRNYDLECGALYHAVHGLALYRTRRFGPGKPLVPSQADESVAAQPAADSQSSER